MDFDKSKTSHIDWDRLRTFYYVAKVGSFTSASEYLKLSQSAVSRQIIDLEARLEKKLFNRLARGLVLSRHGEILFEHVKAMKISIEEARIQIDQEGKEPSGQLNVYTTSGFADTCLNPYVSDFLKKYPKINLSIMGLDIAPDLQLGVADVLLYPSIKPREGLIQRHLMDFHLKLYASPVYLEKHGTPKTVEDLDHHQLISYGHQSDPFPLSNWLLTLGKPEGERREPYAQVNSIRGRIALAEKGLGITTVSVEHPLLATSDLVEVLPDVDGPVIDCSFMYTKQQEKSKKLQAFITWLEELYKNK